MNQLVFPRILFVWLLLSVTVFSADQAIEIPLWPSGAPGSEGKTGKEAVRGTPDGERVISNGHSPSLTAYLPAGYKTKNPPAAGIIIRGAVQPELWVDDDGRQ